MSKVYLICGKICSGKTTYAKKLCKENNAILLSVDEIMLSLFDQCCGEKHHQEYERRIKNYLFDKALEILETENDVFLDWGFWTKEEREETKKFSNPVILTASFIILQSAMKYGNIKSIKETMKSSIMKQKLIILNIIAPWNLHLCLKNLVKTKSILSFVDKQTLF